MSVVEDTKLTVVDSGLPCDTFNFICRARLRVDTAIEHARKATRYFQEAQRPFSWWVSPADQPGDFDEILPRIGLERAETELAMAVDLGRLDAPPEVPGVAVRRVTSEAELMQYASLLAALWTPPDRDVITFYTRGAARLLTEPCPVRCHVTYLDGEAVGTVEMTVAGGVAGLYNISTVERYRGRGIGTLSTVHPLLEAREQGVAVAVLQAAATGVGVYERVGFQRFGEIAEFKPPASWFDDP